MLEEATTEFTPTATVGKPKLADAEDQPEDQEGQAGQEGRVQGHGQEQRRRQGEEAEDLRQGAEEAAQEARLPQARQPWGRQVEDRHLRVKVKNSAKKGKKPKVTFTATATGVKKKTGKATVKVK